MDFLEMSIQSVANQTFNDLELICVDDGSTDCSLDYLNELKDKYSFIKIIEQKNQGSSKARNNGLKYAKGEYVGFLDSDDIFIDKIALEEMYSMAIENDANCVSGNLKFLELDGTIIDNPHYDANDYAEFLEYGNIDPRDYGIPYAFYKCIFKKEFLEKHEILFPDLLRGQDPVFMAKVLINCNHVFTVPLDLYGYNHAVGGGVNAKINTYEKKMAYIQHFKDTYDVLANGGLQNTADFYKIHLFRFLNWAENAQDSEIFEIFNDVWGIDNKTFDESDFNYTRFIVPAKFYFLLKYASEEFFKKITKDFLQIDIYDTKAIDEIVLEEYFMVIYAYSFEDFKSNCVKYLDNDLRFKKELMEFKVKKFIFNINTHGTLTVRKNAKMVFNNSWIGSDDSFSKYQLRKCYENIINY